MTSFFTREVGVSGESLRPTDFALSGWGEDHLRGYAVSGALVRGASAQAPTGWHLARWTVDLFRPSRASSTRVGVRVVRSGRRLVVIEAQLVQGDVITSRATGLFVKPGVSSGGDIWRDPGQRPAPPERSIVPVAPENRLYAANGRWTTAPERVAGPDKKATWHLPHDIVAGEDITPTQFAATMSDGANLVVNWGSAGLAHINADMTLHLVRPPRLDGLGLVASSRDEGGGIAIGSAVMFDRDGDVGRVSITSLATPNRVIDPQTFQADQMRPS